MNLLQARIEQDGDGISLVIGDQRLSVDEQERAAHPELQSHAGGDVVVGFRPERLGKSDSPPEQIPDAAVEKSCHQHPRYAHRPDPVQIAVVEVDRDVMRDVAVLDLFAAVPAEHVDQGRDRRRSRPRSS